MYLLAKLGTTIILRFTICSSSLSCIHSFLSDVSRSNQLIQQYFLQKQQKQQQHVIQFSSRIRLKSDSLSSASNISPYHFSRNNLETPRLGRWGHLSYNHDRLFSATRILKGGDVKMTELNCSLQDSQSNVNRENLPSYMQRDMHQVIHVIEDAARKAGEIMKQTSGKIAIQKTKMNSSDLVTQSDIECQKIIRESITNNFPNDLFLGEEDVDAGSIASSTALVKAISKIGDTMENNEENNAETAEMYDKKLLFIVDPIDGTTNFQAGLPMFCVSIGVVAFSVSESKPIVVAGVIYNPILDEIISAVKSRGCYLNGLRLPPSRNGTSQPKEALINIGFPVSSESTLRASSRAVAALATSVRGLRMIASASQVMSWVAQGKLNGYVSWDLNAWDVAAGIIIVEESGGFVSDFEGKKADIFSRDLIVTCKEPLGGSSLSTSIRSILEDNDCLNY